MDEYIKREAAIEVVKHAWAKGLEPSQYLEIISTADVAPVRHGRWLHTEEPLGWQDVDCMECSACHDSWIIEEDYCFDDMPLWNYCPSCGAIMDGGAD